MKRMWFTFILIFSFLAASAAIINVYGDEETMVVDGTPSADLGTAQYPQNLLDGLWYQSDGVDTPSSGYQTHWDGITGHLGTGTYPWDVSFFDGSTTTGLAGLFTTDSHTIDFTAAASELVYDVNSYTATIGTGSGTLSSTEVIDGTNPSEYHTTEALANAPLGWTPVTNEILFGDQVSFVGQLFASGDGWNALDSTANPSVNDFVLLQAPLQNPVDLIYSFPLPDLTYKYVTQLQLNVHMYDFVLHTTVVFGFFRDVTGTLLYGSVVGNLPNGPPSGAGTLISYTTASQLEADTITSLFPTEIRTRFIGQAITAGTNIIFHRLWISINWTPQQSYTLQAFYTLTLFSDDDHPADAVDPDYLNALITSIRVRFTDDFVFTGTADIFLVDPDGGTGLSFGNLFGNAHDTWWSPTPISLFQPDPANWIFSDGSIKIGITCQSNPVVSTLGQNIYVDVDFIQFKLYPLAIPFTPIDVTTTGFDTLAIRGKGTFDIYTTGHTFVGTFSSVSYDIQIFSVAGTIHYIGLETVSSGSIDWITLTDTPTIDLRDIDKGGSTSDFYSGSFYPDNTVPHDLAVSPSSFSQTGYFCALHDFEWFRSHRSVSITALGTFRDNGLRLTYRTSGATGVTVQVGLRDSSGTWHYKPVSLQSTWTVLEIPLTEFALASFTSLEFLIEDTGTTGDPSVETFTLELSELAIVKLPIPFVIIDTPLPDIPPITGDFQITGNVTDDGTVDEVIVGLNDIAVHTLTPFTSPFDFDVTINSLSFDDGNYRVWVNATDNDGSKNYDFVDIQIDNYQDPVITILGFPRQVCHDTLTVTATVDAITTVTSVTFYLNDTLLEVDTTDPYSTEITTAIQEGEYILTAVALDANDQTDSDSISLLIDSTPPPLIEFLTLNPTNDLVDLPHITIKVDVTSIPSTVVRVEFYINDQILDTDTSTPYQHTFYFGNLVENGTNYTVRVVAYDALGQTNWNEANFTYYYTTFISGGETLLDYVIDIINWIVDFFTSTFGSIFGVVLAVGSGAIAVTRHRRQLAWVAGGGTIITGIVSGIILSPTAGIGIGLILGLCTALGIGTGLIVRRRILPTIQTQCRENPQMKRCQTFLKDMDFRPIITSSRPHPIKPNFTDYPKSPTPPDHRPKKKSRSIL